MSLTLDRSKPTEEDEEFKKLYALLSGLSSKSKPKSDNDVIPVISLAEVGKTEKHTSSKDTISLLNNKDHTITLTQVEHQPDELCSKDNTLLSNEVRIIKPSNCDSPAIVSSKPAEPKPSSPPSPPATDLSFHLNELRKTMELKCKEMIEEQLNEFKKKYLLSGSGLIRAPIKLKKRPIAGDLLPRNGTSSYQCEGCMKIFLDSNSLQYHYATHHACNTWKSIPNKADYVTPAKSIYTMIYELLDDITMTNNKNKCKYCHQEYGLKVEIRKHYLESTLCNRMAYYEFKENFTRTHRHYRMTRSVMTQTNDDIQLSD